MSLRSDPSVHGVRRVAAGPASRSGCRGRGWATRASSGARRAARRPRPARRPSRRRRRGPPRCSPARAASARARFRSPVRARWSPVTAPARARNASARGRRRARAARRGRGSRQSSSPTMRGRRARRSPIREPDTHSPPPRCIGSRGQRSTPTPPSGATQRLRPPRRDRQGLPSARLMGAVPSTSSAVAPTGPPCSASCIAPSGMLPRARGRHQSADSTSRPRRCRRSRPTRSWSARICAFWTRQRRSYRATMTSFG